MRLTDPKKTREILSEYEARFLDGERLTIEDIIKEQFSADSRLAYLSARDAVKGWVGSLKRRFKVGHDLWFGVVNDLGQYGIAITEAEYRYVLVSYFSRIRGSVLRAVKVRSEAQSKGFLPEVKMTLLQLPEVQKKEE